MSNGRKVKADQTESRNHEIPVSVLGYEAGFKRAARRPDEDTETWLARRPDHINVWRENLTGLSQVYDLYFVAIKEKIHIYAPCHPEQKLGQRPVGVIETTRSGANTTGYIDPGCPHSINHLLVAFLGELEILLVCCDDGDVVAYFTKHIRGAIEDDSDLTSLAVDRTLQLRPMMCANVGRSAWGLAVHTAARKIAVSANTRNVTIFSFALTSSNTDLEIEDAPWITEADAFPACPEITVFTSHTPSAATTDRAVDRRLTLRNHPHNLPSVAFCNTGEDLEGRWLACGDIQGTIYMWDLFSSRTVESTRAEFCRGQVLTDGTPRCMCDPLNHRFPHAIWGLHWLDPRSFRPVTMYDMTSAVRMTTDEMKRLLGKLQPRDISYQRTMVARSAQRFNILSRRAASGTTSIHSPRNSAFQAIVSDGSSDIEAADGSNLRSDSDASSSEAASSQLEDVTNGSDDEILDSILWQADVLEGVDTEDEDDDLEPHAYRAPAPQFRRDIRVTASSNGNESSRILPDSPFISLSQNDIFLQQPRGMNNDPEPIFGLHDPFKQTVPNFRISQSINPYNRISLNQTIPELGLMVVGTPKGRVAILSLLQCDASAKSDKKKASFAQPLKHRDPIYFLRLEWILPFKDQEENGQRPLFPLVGLAAGPMKGMQAGPCVETAFSSHRRWRLILTWADHTVLSYEIGLKGSGGIDCNALLV